MEKFVIITDSACDLSAEQRARFGIAEYLHGVLYFPDGHEEYADLDWSSFSPETYYNSMKGRKALYRTSCATLGETETVFEKYLSAGKDVLCIAMSSSLSCTYQNCVSVGREVQQRYPDRKFICVDSLRYSGSLAVLLSLAAQKRDSGATIEETAEYLENIKHCIHQMGPMDDLFFLVKTGRITNFKALFGTLVGVNPMADFNSKGLATVLGKFKGKSAAFDATIAYMKQTIVNPQEQIIFVAHSNRAAAAQVLADMIEENFHPKEIIINPVGVSCGAAIGPGLCAAYYVGTKISEDGSFEQNIMNNILQVNTSADKTSAQPSEVAEEVGGNTESFVLFGDSVCDLDAQMRRDYGIDYIKMNYVIDGVEYEASLDWESHTASEYYNLMRDGKRVTTTQVPMERYLAAFEPVLASGRDAVYIACSSALSGSINTAAVVARDLAEKYPNNRVYCIDSLCSSLGQGMMLVKASRLRKEGKSASEVADYINGTKLNINQHGTPASLEYLRRAGRVKASKAFFGNLFGVKPIIISDKLGQNYAVKKIKGTAASYEEIARMIAECTQGYETEDLYLSHADCLDSITRLQEEILKVTPFKNVYINTIGPIVGASVGPGTVISFCFGKAVEIEGQE